MWWVRWYRGSHQRGSDYTLTPIVALMGGLYDMVPWREVLIGVGIVVWLWAGLQKSHVLGRSLDELKANLHRLEDKLDAR